MARSPAKRRRAVPATTPSANYALDPATGDFTIENYTWAPPFSNFLPGIAGEWGIPVWVYYVNRGQALSSLGVRDKNGQILEFQSFNTASMRIAREGFRAFLRLDGGAVYEPFQRTADPAVRQTMIIRPAEFVIIERNESLQIEIEVAYVPMPNMPVAALARNVRVRNLSGGRRRLEWIDGAARILPSGLDQARIKFIPRHIEGMFGVVDCNGVPLFRLKQTAADTEQVERISGGHFYAPISGERVVVDPECVFGEAFELESPWTFAAGGARAVLDAPELRDNKTACAFVVRDEVLIGRGELELTALIGHVHRDDDLKRLMRHAARPDFFKNARMENDRVVQEISDHCFTISSEPAFDAYAKQNFLDNVIRGGMPKLMQTAHGRSAFYVYSRQNGDLERDYHYFVLEPTYLSQGTGHYRSVLQNRRTDTWFFPEIEDANLLMFLNLVQLDGYNPLEVMPLNYRAVDQDALTAALKKLVPDSKAQREELRKWMSKSFTPGEFIMRLEKLRGKPLEDRDVALALVMPCAVENEIGGLHEGFWVDHWHYNVDLLDIYLMIYPERLRQVLIEERRYSYFDDPDVVLPRSERSVDAGNGRIRMYGAVARDPEKAKRIKERKSDPHTVRTRHGDGDIYRTNLLVKLLTIAVNRVATLDPAGTGIEMEAGKPGWNDSMNGLPGLFGSGLSETIELRKLVRRLQDALAEIAAESSRTSTHVYNELAQFMRALRAEIRKRLKSKKSDAAFQYWEKSNALKERYREQTKFGIAGDEEVVAVADIAAFLKDARQLLDSIFTGPRRRMVLSPDGVPYTYFVNEVVRSKPLGRKSHLGFPLVRPLAFKQRPVRLFLEGAVHWMKDRPAEAREVYGGVRRSEVYDRKLKMYKACEDMTGEDHELGRAVGAYPRGWIENESIYLHMEYKYLLEILRSGLCAEFWRDARTALMPFMDPATYGRSTLEGASFIVSSAYADEKLHGRAFQPRLSGLTCEFAHMWILATAGEHPFRTNDSRELELSLGPRLPGWLFTEKTVNRQWHDPGHGWRKVSVPANSFAFKFLGHTLVVYHNPSRRNTFGSRGVRPVSVRLEYRDGTVSEIDSGIVGEPHARALRENRVLRLDIKLS